MGDLIRFPGAAVDWTYLDEFEWTDELLREYADRARELALRFGGGGALLPRWPPGPPCPDCGQRGSYRVRVGRRLFCPDCGYSRARFTAALAEAA